MGEEVTESSFGETLFCEEEQAPSDNASASNKMVTVIFDALLNVFMRVECPFYSNLFSFVLMRNIEDAFLHRRHLFNNWFSSLDLGRLSAAAVVVALALLLVILPFLKMLREGSE